MQPAQDLITAALALRTAVDRLRFPAPVSHVYDPLDYAWDIHRTYLERFAHTPCRAVFLGMNPGPFGMVQTGVPFGDVGMVRDWMGLSGPVSRPRQVHPKRPIEGFACPRSEVSGRRLWGLFAERFGTADRFFRQHFVANYCPLAFMEDSGRNRTPDKLPERERTALFRACDEHLVALVRILSPEWVVGVGRFAADRAETALADHADLTSRTRITTVPHPSPANPAANAGWSPLATRVLTSAGVW